jgi:hypothetical protein
MMNYLLTCLLIVSFSLALPGCGGGGGGSDEASNSSSSSSSSGGSANLGLSVNILNMDIRASSSGEAIYDNGEIIQGEEVYLSD